MRQTWSMLKRKRRPERTKTKEICLSGPGVSLSLQHCCFEPRERLAAKCLLIAYAKAVTLSSNTNNSGSLSLYGIVRMQALDHRIQKKVIIYLPARIHKTHKRISPNFVLSLHVFHKTLAHHHTTVIQHLLLHNKLVLKQSEMQQHFTSQYCIKRSLVPQHASAGLVWNSTTHLINYWQYWAKTSR